MGSRTSYLEIWVLVRIDWKCYREILLCRGEQWGAAEWGSYRKQNGYYQPSFFWVAAVNSIHRIKFLSLVSFADPGYWQLSDKPINKQCVRARPGGGISPKMSSKWSLEFLRLVRCCCFLSVESIKWIIEHSPDILYFQGCHLSVISLTSHFSECKTVILC